MDIFAPIKIASLPRVLRDFESAGQLGHDEFGIYALMPLIVRGEHYLSNDLTFTAFAGYDSGRTLNTFRIETGGTSLSAFPLRVGRGPYYGTELAGADSAEIDSSLFVGVQPTIALFLQTVFTSLTLDIGLEGNLKWIGKNAGAPFPALSNHWVLIAFSYSKDKLALENSNNQYIKQMTT